MKFLWGFMGLYFLNISVDCTDRYPNFIPENLSINDQESIIEIVVEKILGYEDAIKEYDDHDKEDHTYKANFKIDILNPQSFTDDSSLAFVEIILKKYPSRSFSLTNGHCRLKTPPPKV